MHTLTDECCLIWEVVEPQKMRDYRGLLVSNLKARSQDEVSAQVPGDRWNSHLVPAFVDVVQHIATHVGLTTNPKLLIMSSGKTISVEVEVVDRQRLHTPQPGSAERRRYQEPQHWSRRTLSWRSWSNYDNFVHAISKSGCSSPGKLRAGVLVTKSRENMMIRVE